MNHWKLVKSMDKLTKACRARSWGLWDLVGVYEWASLLLLA